MSILTAPSAFQVPDCWRTVKFGVCVPDQSTECGAIGASLAPSTSICMRGGELGSLRICAEISLFEIEGGRVQVGLRLTLVISAGGVGEGLSVVPTSLRQGRSS